MAFSRLPSRQDSAGIKWLRLEAAADPDGGPKPLQPEIHNWISLLPIWTLEEHFGLLESYNLQRVVALSSTSRFTKEASPDPDERAVARRLAEGERRLARWAGEQRAATIILRPTLIYGYGRDQNISEIARFIRRFGFFPVCGAASGLRQPVHADDVAAACLAALETVPAGIRHYNLSGAEILTYRTMVSRVFAALGKRPVFLPLPLWVFRIATVCLNFLSPHGHSLYAMAKRMNHDLVFDHSAAQVDLKFFPRQFQAAMIFSAKPHSRLGR
jgi:nucleoside-diphosphate-sugar epimerase